jgi:hypothetical protein
MGAKPFADSRSFTGMGAKPFADNLALAGNVAKNTVAQPAIITAVNILFMSPPPCVM